MKQTQAQGLEGMNLIYIILEWWGQLERWLI